MPKFSPLSPSEPRVHTANPDVRVPTAKGEDVCESELLTVKEAADLLRCSKSYLDKLRCAGGGPEFVRLGVRKIIYRRVDLLNWAKSRRFDSTSQYGQ